MNFDLPSLKDSLKELNDIHNKEIYTLKENKRKYTVYKNNKVYFKGNKNSTQDYAIEILNGLYTYKAFRFEEGIGTFTVYKYDKEYYSANNNDGYAYLKIIMLLNYEILYHSKVAQVITSYNIESVISSMIHSVA